MKLSCSWKGCLFGCLGLVVAGILCSVGITLWIQKKGEFEVSGNILQLDTELYARMYVQEEDKILVDFLSNQIEEISANNNNSNWMPGPLQQWNNNKQRRDIEKLLPMEVEIEGMLTQERMAGTVGFSIYGNVIKVIYWFFKNEARADGRVHEYGDATYVEVVESHNAGTEVLRRDLFHLSLYNNMIYVADSAESMERMLDSQREPKVVEGEDRRLAGLDLSAPVYGFFNGFNQSQASMDAIREKLSEFSNDEAVMAFLERVSRVGYELKIEDTKTMAGKVLFDTEDRSDLMKAAIEEFFTQASRDSRLEVSWTVEEGEWGFEVNLRLTNFAGAATTGNKIITVQ